MLILDFLVDDDLSKHHIEDIIFPLIEDIIPEATEDDFSIGLPIHATVKFF